MILATALAVIALFAVAVVVHVEQRDEAAARSSDAAASQDQDALSAQAADTVLTPAWTSAMRGAGSVEELAAASFPRARMGYAPLAVRAVLAHMAAAYADLAAVSDPAVVADAWDRSRRRLAGDPGSHDVSGDAAPSAGRPGDDRHGDDDAGQPAANSAPTPGHGGDRRPEPGVESERDVSHGT